ncbi:MAG: NAD+ synthase [Proteobacteria bacterium]|jgi:NAD+ synthase (glutamine-hydrolysing)|nr:NAD+ synthase [Pseudomonadota bacterium]
MRIAVAQINTTLGSFKNNSEKILDYVRRAKAKHCDLVVFPESTIFGYHPFDLLERKDLVENQLSELKRVQKQVPQGIAVILGVITKNQKSKGRPYFNSAALIQKGKPVRFFHKQLLPTGDVFDEMRFIESGDMSKNYFKYKGKTFFLTICEDIWAWEDSRGKSIYQQNPLAKVKKQKVACVLNLSASPFYPGKDLVRERLVKKTAKAFKAPMIYANLVGAQDEIIFDGGSFALDKNGKKIMQSIFFDEDLNVLDLNKHDGGLRPQKLSRPEKLRQALVLGIRDFCRKTGLQKIHLGLSGGVDSALVACLATEALGPAQITTIAMPTAFNSPLSLELAQKLARNLGVNFREVAIEESYQALKKLVDDSFQVKQFGLVHENLQARVRGLILMAFSNLNNSLLLSTSNKSEYATGYSTLYGDMCGGMAPIGDLTKQEVYALCELYNSELELIPNEIMTRAPSAELRPSQKDQDSLPEYSLLDESVVRIVENVEPLKTPTDQWLFPVLLRTEFKRWQAPPILKVSAHSFGRGRRWPIAHQLKI